MKTCPNDGLRTTTSPPKKWKRSKSFRNRSFLSWLFLLLQNKSSYTTFHMEINLIFKTKKVHEKLISKWKVVHKDSHLKQRGKATWEWPILTKKVRKGRRGVGVPKQRNGGHVCVPQQSSEIELYFYANIAFSFSNTNMARGFTLIEDIFLTLTKELSPKRLFVYAICTVFFKAL